MFQYSAFLRPCRARRFYRFHPSNRTSAPNVVPASITQRRNSDEKPAIFAVGGTAEPQLVVEWLPSRGRSAEFLSVQVDVFRVNNTSPTFQIGFGYGQAGVLLPLLSKIRVGSIGQ